MKGLFVKRTVFTRLFRIIHSLAHHGEPRKTLINIRHCVSLPDQRWKLRNLTVTLRTFNWCIPNIGVSIAKTKASKPIYE
ncbi:MAG: hypothetical protein BWX92_00942 [Deltaproteobacteria bacterium ADurb.Bin135]|nr:MAG: hypothetical protein BWX92_00942 [Deltaproteobacteria bacterium ADurb.Bin135]